MIFDAFLNAFSYIFQLFISILPEGSGFPQEVFDSTEYLGSMVGMLNPLIPIDTLAIILSLIIGVELVIFGFKTFKWLISHIPFIGGRG